MTSECFLMTSPMGVTYISSHLNFTSSLLKATFQERFGVLHWEIHSASMCWKWLCKGFDEKSSFPREILYFVLRDSVCTHVQNHAFARDLMFCTEISVWKGKGCRLLDFLELILSALQTLVNFLFMSVITYLYCSSNLDVKSFETASVSELFIANQTNLKTNCKQGIENKEASY
jgi:hypothetical protein